MTNRTFLLSVGIPILLLGLAVRLRNRHLQRRVQEAQDRWLTADGLILESQVVKERGIRTAVVYAYQPHYQYSVGGNTYEGRQATLVDIRTAASYPQDALASKYPSGQQVTVYDDPHQPQRSALELSLSEGIGAFRAMAWFLFGFGGLLILLALLTG